MSLTDPNDPRVAHHYADLGEVPLHYVTAAGCIESRLAAGAFVGANQITL